MEAKNKKQITYIVVAVLFLLILVIGAAYSYFQVLSSSNVSTTNTQGQTDTMPKGTLVTNRDAVLLKINLDANLMSKDNSGVTYYATESGVPVTSATEGSGKYVLATASLDKVGLVYDCTYSYIVTATKKNDIYDESDADVKIRITGSNGYTEKYTLQEIINDGSKTYNGKIKGLTYGENQKIYVEAYVENTNEAQDDLTGNEFTFTLSLVENSFKCDFPLDIEKEAKDKDFAQFLVDNNTRVDGLWNSGLEGDGYRYVGTGVTCSYDNGNYIIEADNQYTTPSCPTLYNYTQTRISDGSTYNYTYSSYCPRDTSKYTYSCTELTGTLNSNNVPSNFICFGTTDKTECKNNEAKYMYRIIGAFPDSETNQHLKLISLKHLDYNGYTSFPWWLDYLNDEDFDHGSTYWAFSTLISSLNEEYFLDNYEYAYMQSSIWRNKIEDWTWTTVNTLSTEDGTYYRGGPDYNNITIKEVYLHEMKRSSNKINVGDWTTATAKIGLMYVSDYFMSIGSKSLSYIYSDILENGWMHESNNDSSMYSEWTIASYGFDYNGIFCAWAFNGGSLEYHDLEHEKEVRPVFYLTSDVEYNSGTGTYADPFIINE